MIRKFEDYSNCHEMAMKFLKNLEIVINESTEESEYKKIESDEIEKFKSGVKGDIKLNFNLIGTFGTGIGALYPIVDNLISKSSISIDTRSVVLLTIAAVYLIVLDEKKYLDKTDVGNRKQIMAEAKIILSELQLAGFPNATTGSKNGSDSSVLSKVVECLKAVKKIFFVLLRGLYKIGLKDTLHFLFRGSGSVTSGFIDMITYTAMLVPVMNGINAIIGIYNMDINMFLSNLAIFSAAITSILMKNGINYLLDKLKNVLRLSDKEREKIKKEVEDIERPLIKKVSDMGDNDGDLIKEQ